MQSNKRQYMIIHVTKAIQGSKPFFVPIGIIEFYNVRSVFSTVRPTQGGWQSADALKTRWEENTPKPFILWSATLLIPEHQLTITCLALVRHYNSYLISTILLKKNPIWIIHSMQWTIFDVLLSMLNKTFLEIIFKKFKALFITLHLVPFESQWYKYSSHSESFKIHEKSS